MTTSRLALRKSARADLAAFILPATVRNDRLMDDIDLWTAGSRGQMPLHEIAVGDPRNTYYYISEETGNR